MLVDPATLTGVFEMNRAFDLTKTCVLFFGLCGAMFASRDLVVYNSTANELGGAAVPCTHSELDYPDCDKHPDATGDCGDSYPSLRHLGGSIPDNVAHNEMKNYCMQNNCVSKTLNKIDVICSEPIGE